ADSPGNRSSSKQSLAQNLPLKLYASGKATLQTAVRAADIRLINAESTGYNGTRAPFAQSLSKLTNHDPVIESGFCLLLEKARFRPQESVASSYVNGEHKSRS